MSGVVVTERRPHHPYPNDTWVQEGYEFVVSSVLLWVDDGNNLRWDVTLVGGRKVMDSAVTEEVICGFGCGCEHDPANLCKKEAGYIDALPGPVCIICGARYVHDAFVNANGDAVCRMCRPTAVDAEGARGE